RLRGQLVRIHQAWPAPWLLVSLVGLFAARPASGGVRRPGAWLAPLAIVPVLPALGVTPHLRYPMTLIPALACLAAFGGARIAAWRPEKGGNLPGTAFLVVTTALLAGLAWCWTGPAGDSARHFEDGPIRSMRRAGEWLARNGTPGARVMDRKPYVPF